MLDRYFSRSTWSTRLGAILLACLAAPALSEVSMRTTGEPQGRSAS